MIISGMKHTMSRIIEAMTARIGFPTAWKKIEVILIMQVKVTRQRKMRKQRQKQKQRKNQLRKNC